MKLKKTPTALQMIEFPAYFDYASTTPMDKKVLEAMIPYFSQKFGNPESKTHSYGRSAKAGVDQSRKMIAEVLGAEEGEIIFTSGATESINHALKGIYDKFSPYGKHIISASTEHQATLDTLKFLEEKGAEVTLLQPNQQGLISKEQVEKAIRKDTVLISIMWVNNETGVIQNIPEIARLAQDHNVLFFTDATQAVGKVNIHLKDIPLAGMAFSGHKIYGPKGIGGLFLSRKNPRTNLSNLIHGGQQEFGKRAGTLNVPSIVGFAKAMEQIHQNNEILKIQELSKKITDNLKEKGATINGNKDQKVPHIINAMAPQGINAARLFKSNPRFAFSLGSACTSGKTDPSHVLLAMGYIKEEAERCFRISIGKTTTEEEVQYFCEEFRLSI